MLLRPAFSEVWRAMRSSSVLAASAPGLLPAARRHARRTRPGSSGRVNMAGTLALVQIISWKPLAVRGNALLWILYVGYSSIGIGLLMAALQYAGVDLPRVLPVHTIAMAGFSVMIIGMVTRTALGHTGRPLATDRTIRASYWLMLIAVALRLAAIAATPATATLLHIAAAAWIASLALYLWQFTPMLIRPRN